MSHPNLSTAHEELEQVCFCPKGLSFAGQRAGYFPPRHHDSDCQMFEDYSTGERESAATNEPEYVF